MSDWAKELKSMSRSNLELFALGAMIIISRTPSLVNKSPQDIFDLICDLTGYISMEVKHEVETEIG